ncbi:MAG: coproporphyrinogen III oxidase, partial [Flavobacteriales bacterium]|nr:coproporphyrinogen III oxidase [Flavobacteriales bacterium]MCB0786977.1 coproporphyrinogen III oxidase [Flavobacteriales bacterium]
HNRSYWTGTPYLGIGPSAHSFDGGTRRWNVAHNMRYVQGVEAGIRYWEEETPSPQERTNELLLTGLRTAEGVVLSGLPVDVLREHGDVIRRYVEQGQLVHTDGRIALTRTGKHVADRIASDLFLVP